MKLLDSFTGLTHTLKSLLRVRRILYKTSCEHVKTLVGPETSTIYLILLNSHYKSSTYSVKTQSLTMCKYIRDVLLMLFNRAVPMHSNGLKAPPSPWFPI